MSPIVIVAVLAWLIRGGYFAAFGHWMHTSDVGTALRYIIESLVLLVCVLLSTAALIYIQRKIWGAVQLRRGPNVVGPWGILQPFADFFKFILKEPIIPASANKGVFLLAPLVSVVLAFAAWAVIPVSDGWVGRRHQRWAPLSFRGFLAWRVRRHHGGVGVKFEICAALVATRSRSNGVL